MQHDKHQLIVLVEGVCVAWRTKAEVDPLPSIHVVAQESGVGREELPVQL